MMNSMALLENNLSQLYGEFLRKKKILKLLLILFKLIRH